jgi:YkoY family integral membrane protein
MQGVLEFLQLTSVSWADLVTILTLILLEGTLMCDNAVALAMLVRRLPEKEQGRALRYGILGAYVFLFLALVLASWIMNQWYLKVLGGLYLLWVASGHFFRHKHETSGMETPHQPSTRRILGLSPFWSTVITVELTDIAFSVDSIAAAVALSSKLWVLMIGSMAAILCMRFAAQGFIKLLKRFPRLETSAFIAVSIIGIMLVVELPLDIFGFRQQLAPDKKYATALEYATVLHEHQHERALLQIPGIVSVNSGAVDAPSEEAFANHTEYRDARSKWHREGRAFVHINEWAASALILLVLATGFIKRKNGAAG